jgi:hypothetical protein
MYNITLSHAVKRPFETFGFSGVTCERDLQKLAASVFGEGEQFTISAPQIGLYQNSVSRR